MPRRMKRIVLMSIKPKFGYRILRGKKKFELRKYTPEGKIRSGDIVFLYFSYPVRAILCMFKAGRVYEGTRDELMSIAERFKDNGLGSEDWSYLDARRPGMMIEVRKPKRIRRITLERLREMFGFEPPRSYHILDPEDPIYKLLARRIH
ncbi:MAG: DNA-binding protein [Thaumarchaeota archaeon]|nr:DNA-binding protein [Nitrososphaerota archaeon]RLG06670.1 MAG: DNA-binding protein [Nitrososphaerota archaeon]